MVPLRRGSVPPPYVRVNLGFYRTGVVLVADHTKVDRVAIIIEGERVLLGRGTRPPRRMHPEGFGIVAEDTGLAFTQKPVGLLDFGGPAGRAFTVSHLVCSFWVLVEKKIPQPGFLGIFRGEKRRYACGHAERGVWGFPRLGAAVVFRCSLLRRYACGHAASAAKGYARPLR
jgi:hypothetical protein